MEGVSTDDSFFHVHQTYDLISLMHIHDEEMNGVQFPGALKWLEVGMKIVFLSAGQDVDDLMLVKIIKDTDIVAVFKAVAGRIDFIYAHSLREGQPGDMTVFIK